MYPQRFFALSEQPIAFLERSGLGTRAQNTLERAGHKTIGDVLAQTFEKLSRISGYDVATHRQFLSALKSEGVCRTPKKSKVHTVALERRGIMDLFENEKFKESANQVMEAIQKSEGSVKVGMTIDGQVHPQSLISILMGVKESQIHTSQQVAVLSSLTKALAKRLPEKEFENVLEEFSADIDAKITHLEEIRKKRAAQDQKPKLVMPGPGGL